MAPRLVTTVDNVLARLPFPRHEYYRNIVWCNEQAQAIDDSPWMSLLAAYKASRDLYWAVALDLIEEEKEVKAAAATASSSTTGQQSAAVTSPAAQPAPVEDSKIEQGESVKNGPKPTTPTEPAAPLPPPALPSVPTPPAPGPVAKPPNSSGTAPAAKPKTWAGVTRAPYKPPAESEQTALQPVELDTKHHVLRALKSSTVFFEPVEKAKYTGLNTHGWHDMPWPVDRARSADGSLIWEKELQEFVQKDDSGREYLSLWHAFLTYHPRLEEDPRRYKQWAVDHAVDIVCDDCNKAKKSDKCGHSYPCGECFPGSSCSYTLVAADHAAAKLFHMISQCWFGQENRANFNKAPGSSKTALKINTSPAKSKTAPPAPAPALVSRRKAATQTSSTPSAPPSTAAADAAGKGSKKKQKQKQKQPSKKAADKQPQSTGGSHQQYADAKRTVIEAWE